MSVGVFFSCWMPASCNRFKRSSSGRRERGIQDYVGIDGERLVEILLERRQADDGEVEVRAGRKLGAEPASESLISSASIVAVPSSSISMVIVATPGDANWSAA